MNLNPNTPKTSAGKACMCNHYARKSITVSDPTAICYIQSYIASTYWISQGVHQKGGGVHKKLFSSQLSVAMGLSWIASLVQVIPKLLLQFI